MRTDRVERFVALARASLVWERIWPSLWPASGIIGLYVAAALFDLFAYIPAWLHVLVLIAALTSAGWLLIRAFSAFVWPDWQDGARRLERDSSLAHRPITERGDVISAGKGDAWSEALWRAHMRRLLASIGRLRVTLPTSDLPERDPRALRFVVVLLLIAGLIVAGHDWSRRLADGLLPDFSGGAPAATLDAWINPPAYTGEAPIYLKSGSNVPVSVAAPIGSKLVLRVHGANAAPRVRTAGGPGAPFKGHDGEFAADYALDKTGNVAVVADGRTLGNWHIAVIADSPPVIAFSMPPSRTLRNAVKITFTAADDYGVVKARALLMPVHAKAKKPLVVDLPIDDPDARTLQQTTYKDLTESPYAGAKVTITLEAVDGAGQIGKSKAVTFTLPARVFTNPLARALVEQRRNLALGGIDAVPRVQRTLAALTIAPARFYADRKGIYTAIRAAYWGLRGAHVRDDIEHVESLLWQTALALEDGGVAQAAERLRRLQQMLSQALQSGASQDRINQLLEQYKDALNKYMQMLAQNAQTQNGPVPPNAKVLSQKDLEDLLNAIQQMAQTGSRQQAAQALAMLQNLLENLHMRAGTGSGQQSPQDKAKSDAVQKLGDLMGRQRELLDKTYRRRQGEGSPQDGGKGLARQQGQLKDQLNRILKGLGDQHVQAPNSLGQAGRSMGNAQGALGQRDYYGAGDAQKNALEDLRKGASELAQSLMNSRPGAQGANQDPFGRTEGSRGALGSGNMKLPDKSTMERAREILKELRKRAAELGRPKEELDYIDRLLKQF